MTVVVSGRGLISTKSSPFTAAPNVRVSSRKSIDLVGLDVTSSYVEIYRTQPWIYALVNKLAFGIGRLPIETLAISEDGEKKTPIRAHPLATLLRRPHPRGTGTNLKAAAIGSQAVYGHGLWWKFRPGAGRAPTELYPLDWKYVSMETGKDYPVTIYWYDGPEGRRALLPEDVVHFTRWSPAGLKGTSPLEPLRRTLALEDAGQRYAISSFANAVRPSGAFTHPNTLSPEDRGELQAEIDEIFAGPDNAFRALLLDGGLDWKTFGGTSQEAQTIEHRKLNREEACAVYDIPPPMVQILDKATFSNIDEQHVMLYADTYGPWYVGFEDTIDAWLVSGEPDFEIARLPDENEIREVEIRFRLDEVLRAQIDKRAVAYSQMRNSGAYTINDLRRAEGLPPIDHDAADWVLVPLNSASIGPGSGEIPPPPEPGSPEAALASIADALAKADPADENTKQLLDALAALSR